MKPPRPCDIDLTVRVKSWALSLSSLDGAVIIVTQMSSSVMSDVVMDVWTDFWWIRALSPQCSHYPSPGADKKCQWAPCLGSNVRLSLAVDVIILSSQPVFGPQLWLSSHPSVAWLPPFQSGNQRLQIGEIRSITHKGNVPYRFSRLLVFGIWIKRVKIKLNEQKLH